MPRCECPPGPCEHRALPARTGAGAPARTRRRIILPPGGGIASAALGYAMAPRDEFGIPQLDGWPGLGGLPGRDL